MKILLIGYGKMGRLIEETARACGDEVVGAIHRENMNQLATLGKVADVVIDFSRPETLPALCTYIRRTGTPLVSGTTGYTPEQMDQLKALSETVPVLWAANFSVGVAVLYRVLQQASRVLRPDFDVELMEAHHNQKADAPSGTAKFLMQAVDPMNELTPVYGREGNVGKRTGNEFGVHALRGGTVAGTHTVYFFGQDEELEFTHRASSRQIFVNGALHIARLMADKPAGWYDLQQILFGD